MHASFSTRETPIRRELLYQLAPLHLPSERQLRYSGDGLRIDLADLAAEDQTLLYLLYTSLQDLFARLQNHQHDTTAGWQRVQAFIQEQNWTAQIKQFQKLGSASYDRPHRPDLSQAIHDIKGGGLVSLSIYMQLIEMGLQEQEDLSRLFFLTRDHLKIMRNAVRDLDPEGEARDQQFIHHNIQLVVEKWNHALHQVNDNDTSAEIVLECLYDGNISESCLEFSALDRVIYNLINNAARHTTDGKVYLHILPLPFASEHPESLRFVVYNRSTPEHLELLAEHYSDTLGELFRGGFTTGGSGIGLRICADSVCNAYGVKTFDLGLAGGYFGATRVEDFFVNWIHWPTAAD